MKRIIVTAALTVAIFSPALIGPAMAKPLDAGQFAGSITGGLEVPVDGDVHGGATAPVASLAALNPNLPAVAAELRIQARSFDDIYGEAASFGVEGAYGLGGGLELIGALRSITADEGQVQVGTAFVPALSASLPVIGRFGEFQSLSIEGGVRQHFDRGGGFMPYIGGRVGVTQVDAIRASFTVPVPAGVGAEPNDIALNNVRFYDDSTAFTLGLDVGASVELTPGFEISIETGLRYQSSLEDDDRDIGGLGLAAINDEGDRLSVPLTVKGTFRF
jgi:opacity protein-like surface antigen